MGMPESVSDGNGGTLDAAKSSQRDLLVSLHVKVDHALATLGDHENRLRSLTTSRDREEGARSELATRRTFQVTIGILIVTAVSSGWWIPSLFH